MPGTRTGNFAPCGAGGFAGNHLIHSSFIPAKSVSSRRITVKLTARSREVPAALRMADTFSKHCLVCSWIVSPTIFPVTGSCGPVPETNTKPAARTAWLYVGGGAGALGVRMMSLAMNFSKLRRTSDARVDAHGACDRIYGGAERDRTADLLVANEALSQLSYSPPPNAHRTPLSQAQCRRTTSSSVSATGPSFKTPTELATQC
jgi:hypothetical protein